MSGPSKRFISYIGHGNVDMLEGFPDSWSCNKKATYLFSIISADSSEVHLALQKLKFGWPKGTTGEIHQVLRKVIDHEKGKKNPKTYDEEDGYDYLRLCRNIVKHWKSISKSVSYLQVLENIIYGSQLSYQISNSVLYQLNCNAAMLSQCGGFSPDDGEMDSEFMVPNIWEDWLAKGMRSICLVTWIFYSLGSSSSLFLSWSVKKQLNKNNVSCLLWII